MKIEKREGNDMVLKIKDVEYEIVTAYVSLRDSAKDYCMSIDIFARTKDEKIASEIKEVQLYIDAFHTNVHSVEELVHKKFVWDSTENLNQEAAGVLNIIDFEDVTKGTIEVLKVEDHNITIHWNGTGNIYWDNEFGKDVPFDTEFTTEFSIE